MNHPHPRSIRTATLFPFTTLFRSLIESDGKSIGQVSIKKEDDGLLVKTTVTGLKPGNYAFHLHTVGKCEAPGFTSAEGHWNPTGKEHGKDNPQGKHIDRKSTRLNSSH